MHSLIYQTNLEGVVYGTYSVDKKNKVSLTPLEDITKFFSRSHDIEINKDELIITTTVQNVSHVEGGAKIYYHDYSESATFTVVEYFQKME